MTYLHLVLSLLLTCSVLAAGPASAQHTVIQQENVRFDYAQVLRVTPVYQTLTATRTEQRCEPAAQDKSDPATRRRQPAARQARLQR